MPEEPNLLTPDVSPSPESTEGSGIEVQEQQEERGREREKEGNKKASERQEAKISPDEQPEVTKKEIAEAPSAAPQVQPSPAQTDQLTKDIEEVLSEGLGDVYLRLPIEKRAAFKQAGEDAAVTIKDMMTTRKVRVRKILDIIRNWLRLVPGVNKFFLEQEAKIKTDKLMDYYRDSQQNDENAL